jgi:hypothetical protein
LTGLKLILRSRQLVTLYTLLSLDLSRLIKLVLLRLKKCSRCT